MRELVGVSRKDRVPREDGVDVVDVDALFDCDELLEEVKVLRADRLTLIDPVIVRDTKEVAVESRVG